MEQDEKSMSGNDSARPWESYNTVYTTAKAGRVRDSCQFYSKFAGSMYFYCHLKFYFRCNYTEFPGVLVCIRDGRSGQRKSSEDSV